jgi:hypothetical protein
VRMPYLAAACAAGLGLTVTGAAASAAGGAYHYRTLSVTVGHKKCSNLRVFTINDRKIIGGTQYCSDPAEGFIQTASGKHRKLVRAPGSGDTDTFVVTVASQGIAAVFTDVNYTQPYASFLRSVTGRWTKLADPHAGTAGTVVSGVNDSATAVGVYYAGSRATATDTRAFLYRHGHFSRLSLGIKAATDVAPSGITNNGEISGTYVDAHDVSHGFLIVKGHTHVVTLPAAGTGKKQGTFIDTVANNGSYTGYTVAAHHERGFVHRNGKTTMLDDSRAEPNSLYPEGLNDNGDVAGSYLGTDDLYHGFLATP